MHTVITKPDTLIFDSDRSHSIVVYNNNELPKELFDQAKKLYYSTSFDFPYFCSMRKIVYQSRYKSVPYNFYSFIEDAGKYMIDKGYNINTKRYSLELYDYDINSGETATKHIFDWHKDDYGGVPFIVNTMLIYFLKDSDLRGGDLLYLDDNYLSESHPNKIIIKPPMIATMRGDVKHAVEDLYGYGKRQLMVLQFERIE